MARTRETCSTASQGSLIAFESGEAVTYGLFNAQERGALFIGPGEKVYAGMVIGQSGKAGGHRTECLQDQASDQYPFLRFRRSTEADTAERS